MKFFKKALSLLLCIAIMATTAVVAFAEGEEPYNPDFLPVIREQPYDVEIKEGEISLFSCGLSVTIPSGDKADFRLCCGDKSIEQPFYPKISDVSESGEYYYIIYNANHPEYFVKTESFKITVIKKTFFDKVGEGLKSIGEFILKPFEFIFNLGVVSLFFGSLFSTAIFAHIVDLFDKAFTR